MKINKSLLTILLQLTIFNIFAQNIEFDQYFSNGSLRFDYIHSGTYNKESISAEMFKYEPFWGGTKTKLISPFDYGKYKLVVKDSATSKPIYSSGYSTLFMEWQTTEEAKNMNKSFYESVIMPFPKNTVIIEILSIDFNQNWTTIYKEYLNPGNYFIHRESIPSFPVLQINGNKTPDKALDIVIIPEGYTKSEMSKFYQDAKRMSSYLFEVSPFKEYAESINIKIVMAPSEESGTDIPGKGVWKNTLLNSNFYTFNSERYLTTTDIKSLRDIASTTYYDQIYILVNTEKYGGGGIYNFYNLCTSDNKYTREVFTHEFGHGLAWLADEYFYDDEMSNFYDKSIEPREANITTLIDFEKKWENKIPKDVKIPTIATPENLNDIGVYEGGGYTSKGVYRAYQNCKMKSNSTNEFCEVCNDAIIEMMKFYSE
ncbi:MAG: M64 family metallopeptidase [Bacteroidota bacterium]